MTAAAAAVSGARIVVASAGDVCALDGELREHVHAYCGARTVGYACCSCKQRLANRFQLECHVETGAHWIARLCEFHGAEEPAPGEIP